MLGRGQRAVRNFGAGMTRHLPLVVLAFSIAANLLLASRLLKAQQPPEPRLKVGTLVDPFAGKSIGGGDLFVDYRVATPTILYHFSPSCGWCERNWSNVRTLIQQTHGRFRFVGVSTTPVTSEFLHDRQLDFEVVTNVSADVAQRYGLGGTPETIVVSENQRILQNWTGAYSGLQAKEVEAYFGLRLPGLGPAPNHQP